MKKGDYYKWKAGEKVTKAPWVKEYYKSVTDENQYDHGYKVGSRSTVIVGGMLFVYGLVIGAVFL